MKMNLKVVCGILIWNDKVLIGKRKLTNEHQPGKWEFPGGKMEEGETIPPIESGRPTPLEMERTMQETLSDLKVFDIHQGSMLEPGAIRLNLKLAMYNLIRASETITGSLR